MKKKMVGSGFGVPAIGKNYGKKATIKKNKKVPCRFQPQNKV